MRPRCAVQLRAAVRCRVGPGPRGDDTYAQRDLYAQQPQQGERCQSNNNAHNKLHCNRGAAAVKAALKAAFCVYGPPPFAPPPGVNLRVAHAAPPRSRPETTLHLELCKIDIDVHVLGCIFAPFATLYSGLRPTLVGLRSCACRRSADKRESVGSLVFGGLNRMIQQQAPTTRIIASSALSIISCEQVQVPKTLRGRVKQLLVRLNGGWQFITSPVTFVPQTDLAVRAGAPNLHYLRIKWPFIYVADFSDCETCEHVLCPSA